MRTVEKPWGKEIWWAHALDKYMGKILHINDGHKLSLQYHEQKDETIYVLEGKLLLVYSLPSGEIRERDMLQGDSFRIHAGTLHRFCAADGDVTLLEVSTDFPEDVVRLEDDYGRTPDTEGFDDDRDTEEMEICGEETSEVAREFLEAGMDNCPRRNL